MARKLCPACRWMNAGSAKECSRCGAAFDAASMVAPTRPREMLHPCPQCAIEVARLTETCVCGHVFSDVRELREQLEHRASVGTSQIVIGAFGLAGCTALMIVSYGVFGIFWFGGGALIARGIATRKHAKASLAEIRTSSRGELPAAKVVR
jgi:hypothetical protein